MKQDILFLTPGNRLDLYIRHGYENPNLYGVAVCALTPRVNKVGFNFDVRYQGKRYTGRISTQGDYIVRL